MQINTISNQFISNYPSDGKLLSNFQGTQSYLTKQQYKLQKKKNGVFLCNKRKTVLKETMHQNLGVSKTLLGKF